MYSFCEVQHANRDAMPSTLTPLSRSAAVCRLMGFTLIEALVVLAVLGVLLSLAVPNLSNLYAKHQLQAQAEGLLDSLMMARSEALKHQQPVTLCARAAAQCDTQPNWQQGWWVFVDTNHNARRDEGEALLEAREAFPLHMFLAANSTVKAYFSYGPDGRSQSPGGGFMAGTWRFCRSADAQGWQVVSNALGQPRVEKYPVQQCP
ncbi:prepilin-type cleavage/methylation domain-containing protein [Limnohabitans sp. G3-2]|nr:prepilin-type cleavage/methylation domain-containing protein [Limnohabitans sp. G3-2]